MFQQLCIVIISIKRPSLFCADIEVHGTAASLQWCLALGKRRWRQHIGSTKRSLMRYHMCTFGQFNDGLFSTNYFMLVVLVVMVFSFIRLYFLHVLRTNLSALQISFQQAQTGYFWIEKEYGRIGLLKNPDTLYSSFFSPLMSRRIRDLSPSHSSVLPGEILARKVYWQ